MLRQYGEGYASLMYFLVRYRCELEMLGNGPMPTELGSRIRISLEALRTYIETTGILRDLLDEIERATDAITDDPHAVAMKVRVDNICQRIMDELDRYSFYYVHTAMVHLYERDDAFGIKVAQKFKKAAPEIKSAGTCIALGQGTASVFHLMRAMEFAVKRLSTRIRAPITPKDTWGAMLSKMKVQIDKMPETTEKKKRKREQWSESRSHLFHVKEAWRDNSMHSIRAYGLPEAVNVYDAVKVFMAHLAGL
jgi:hypothetical protein